MYKAVLFAPNGDWVTDWRESNSIQEVWESLEDMGSKWFFYPIRFVIRDNGRLTTRKQRVVDEPELFTFLHHRSIGTVSKFIADNPDEIIAILTL
jgi:hypothetical protein